MKKRTEKATKMIGVVVTTEHKGVFFGYIPENAKTEVKTITLNRARMCVYWSKAVKGVLGLASNGPLSDCRIGPPVPSLSLSDVTSVCKATDGAVAAWEVGPWQ